MKKIIIIIGIIIISFVTIKLLSKEEKEEIVSAEEVKVIDNVQKEKYKFITTSYDHVYDIIKEEFIEETVVNYIIEEIPKKNGFITENGYTYYYIDDYPVTKEQTIEGDTYFFNDEGILQKDIMIDNKYYDEEGKEYIGFKEIDGNTYYFEREGYVIGEKEIEEDTYFFNNEGILQKEVMIDNKYYDEEGKEYIGFKEVEGKTYYFEKEGYVIGEKEIEEDTYFFNEDGNMAIDKMINNMYFGKDGKRVIGKVVIEDNLLFINEDGIVKDKFIDDKYYDINGDYIEGMKMVDGNVYYYSDNETVKGLRLLNGVRYYFDFETGILKNKNVKSVIDISTWQGDIDFDKLKESNLVDAVIVRLGFGSEIGEACTLDNKFERNISELKRLNIPYGVYFFGYAQNELASKVEAEFVSNVINNYKLDLSFPIFYDAELQTFHGVTYTKTMYRKVINSFIDSLNEKGFDNIGVYGNLYMLSSGGLSTIKDSIPKWVAQYYKECEYKKDYIGWQYTSSGNIPGINGRVDMNIFY